VYALVLKLGAELNQGELSLSDCQNALICVISLIIQQPTFELVSENKAPICHDLPLYYNSKFFVVKAFNEVA
jgi:hypothetical protein